jgi:hypothetical protein
MHHHLRESTPSLKTPEGAACVYPPSVGCLLATLISAFGGAHQVVVAVGAGDDVGISYRCEA